MRRRIVQVIVEHDGEVIYTLTQPVQPAGHSCCAVKLVAMQHEEPLAASRAVRPLAVHFQLPLQQGGKRARAAS